MLFNPESIELLFPPKVIDGIISPTNRYDPPIVLSDQQDGFLSATFGILYEKLARLPASRTPFGSIFLVQSQYAYAGKCGGKYSTRLILTLGIGDAVEALENVQFGLVLSAKYGVQ